MVEMGHLLVLAPEYSTFYGENSPESNDIYEVIVVNHHELWFKVRGRNTGNRDTWDLSSDSMKYWQHYNIRKPIKRNLPSWW